jgi:hypothetical protein
MPVHDWSKVDAGIFHDFRHAWVCEISRTLNTGLLPDDHYALLEHHTKHFEPQVPAIQSSRSEWRGEDEIAPDPAGAGETDLEFYRRKQNVVAIRHVSGDRLVAIVEIVSPGNKSGQAVFRKLVDKAVELLSQDIHLMILDVIPPSRRDPNGIHGAIWEALTDQEYTAPAERPLTLAAYEADMGIRAFVEPVAVGDSLPEMPLFLQPGGHVPVALEATYQSAWQAVPRRWRSVIEG